MMKVQDIMKREVHSCRPDMNLALAAMQMWEGDLGVLPVLDGDQVVGVITDRDICMAAATKQCDLGTIRVDEIMTGQVYACRPDADIHEALKIMRRRQVRRLPVINAENGKLVGILSLDEVALHAQPSRKADLTGRDVAKTLRSICAARSLFEEPAVLPVASQSA